MPHFRAHCIQSYMEYVLMTLRKKVLNLQVEQVNDPLRTKYISLSHLYTHTHAVHIDSSMLQICFDNVLNIWKY